MKTALIQKLRRSAGFTMIELLVVVAILGILAIAVLAAINPVEQINRGRDTANRSDAEQLINALDRYNAFHGFEAFQADADAARTADSPVTMAWTVNGLGTCEVLTRLQTTLSTEVGCENSEEVKDSFITKITGTNYNTLQVYNAGTAGVGTATYVCFTPESNAFRTEAATRCGGTAGAGLPTDLQGFADTVCPAGLEQICLP